MWRFTAQRLKVLFDPSFRIRPIWQRRISTLAQVRTTSAPRPRRRRMGLSYRAIAADRPRRCSSPRALGLESGAGQERPLQNCLWRGTCHRRNAPRPIMRRACSRRQKGRLQRRVKYGTGSARVRIQKLLGMSQRPVRVRHGIDPRLGSACLRGPSGGGRLLGGLRRRMMKFPFGERRFAAPDSKAFTGERMPGFKPPRACQG